ncbi:MAG: putative PEP-binding protein [Anaerolineales bacterium]
MIEIPRAAVTAGDVARDAEFFSFGYQRSYPDDLRLFS